MTSTVTSEDRRRGFSRWVKIGIPLLGLGLLWSLYHQAPLLFTSLMLSWILYYVLSPLVGYLEARHIRRGIASTLVLLGFYVMMYFFFIRLATVTADLHHSINVEDIKKNFKNAEMKILKWAEMKVPTLIHFIQKEIKVPTVNAEVKKAAATKKSKTSSVSPEALPVSATEITQNQLDTFLEKQVRELAPDLAFKLLGFIPNFVLIFVLIPYFTFFFLKDGHSLKKTIIRWIPNRYFELALKFFYEMDRRLRAYLVNTFLDCLLVGLLVGIGSAIVGAPYPLVLGVVAFLFNVIPFVGPVIYMLLCILLTIGAIGSEVGFVDVTSGVAMVLILSRLCDDLIFQPTIFGKTHHIHPVVVVAAILLGHTLAGVWGMLLAIPVVSTLWLGATIIQEISMGEETPSISPSLVGPFA